VDKRGNSGGRSVVVVGMKHVLRVLAREKGFTAFAVLTLALGIGAVTTIFSVVDSVLLKPLSYADPGRLYAASESARQLADTYPRLPVNAAHFHSWLKQCRSCESGALLDTAAFNLTGEGEPERIDGVRCTWRLFQVLGVRPQLGRTFLESDDQPGDNKYVVITDSLWRRRLNADPNVIGRSVRLYGEPHVVVGVLPADFRFPTGDQIGSLRLPTHAEIFKPLGLNWAKASRVGNFNYAALIRLRPGASPEVAQSEMTASIAEAAREMKIDLKAHLTPFHEQVTGAAGGALWLLLAAVGCVLVIVCVNLGNLILVRANKRLRDAAIRRALGASRLQLFRPILGESILIAAAGGALGVLLAYAGVRILVSAAPVDIPRLDEVHLDIAALLFATAVSAACGILCGLWPALRMTRSQPVDALQSGSRSSTESRGKLQSREWLVGIEVALSTVLVIVAALLGVSFVRLINVERGYDVDRILTADLTLPGSRYQTDGQKSSFHQRLLDELEAAPGVRSAALISALPLKAQRWGDLVTKEGETRPVAERPPAWFRFVSSRYFEVMGIALRRGRFPAESDRPREVALVSESTARKVWPGEDAVGKRIRKTAMKDDPNRPFVEVIGVVADVRTASLDQAPPLMVYVPYWDGPYWQGGIRNSATYVLRTSQDPSTMVRAFRSAVHRLDAELPLAHVLTMKEIMSESVGGRRFQTFLAGVFALSALLLACLGIYGVISYGVARRTNEIGIRMALGAQSSQVTLMVLGQGMKPVLGGLFVGVLTALWAGQLLSSFLFGVGARDPATLSAVVVLLFGVSAGACWAPARRASRIDPMIALRYE
jgi:predicted permease